MRTRAVPINFCAKIEFFRTLCEDENGSRAETVQLPYQCWLVQVDSIANID